MAQRHKIDGLYYGKLETEEQVAEFKEAVIRRYKHTHNKNIGALHRDLLKEGYDIPYHTIRTWLRRSQVTIVRARDYVSEKDKKVPSTVYLTNELWDSIDGFSDYLTKTDMFEFAMRMLVGMPTDNIMCLFFSQGNVILTEKNNTITAMYTGDLSQDDVKLLTGMVNMAEEYEDWIEFIQKWCKKSGILHYPNK